MLAQVIFYRLPVLQFHLLTMGIGEETCCRTVGAKMVQLLICSTLGSACTVVALEDLSENGRIYVTGVSYFPLHF